MGGFLNPRYKIVFEEADKTVRSILSSLLFMEIHMVKVGQLCLRPILSQDYFGNISGTISSTTNSTSNSGAFPKLILCLANCAKSC
jgi:hypothetical protein